MPLCTWNLEDGHVVIHEQAIERDNMLVLPEEARVGFVLDPAVEACEYRIFIGDVPLGDISPTPDDASGVLLGGRMFWRDLSYFDSARGHTPLIVETRSEAAGHDTWATLLSTSIYVLPSKLGEERYQAMSADLDRVSHGLLVDLYGKSRRSVDVRYAKAGRTHYSREAELQAIESTLVHIEGLLKSIALRPASRIVAATRSQEYWGAERLHPAAVAGLARSGTDLRTAPRPVRVMTRVKTETFDVAEHRFIRAFLALLLRRCEYCSVAAASHARAITAERHLRDIRLGDGPTIYESVDLSRIARLQHAVETAQRCEAMALAMQRLPFLRDVPSVFSRVRGGMFQRNDEYVALYLIIRHFLVECAQWYEGDAYSTITKLTWRIFEQWTFLRVVDAFRAAGVDLCEWTDALRQNLQSRFIIDFDRGLMFEAALGPDLRLRFRYEPWILARSAAIRAGETLFRGQAGEVAWCPDIVIECLRKHGDAWISIYAIVLDCKYTPRIRTHHWNGVTKYLEIRSTDTGRQVAKQLWLVYPSDLACVESEDPTVDFATSGPSCDASEAVRFRLSVTPDSMGSEGKLRPKDDGFAMFAEGTLAFLRRAFGMAGPGHLA
jgi:hypothetical protein